MRTKDCGEQLLDILGSWRNAQNRRIQVMSRANGWYFVRIDDEWRPAEWFDGDWDLSPMMALLILEVDEDPISIPPVSPAHDSTPVPASVASRRILLAASNSR